MTAISRNLTKVISTQTESRHLFLLNFTYLEFNYKKMFCCFKQLKSNHWHGFICQVFIYVLELERSIEGNCTGETGRDQTSKSGNR